MNSVAAAPVLSRRRSVSPPSARSLLLTVLGELVLPNDNPVWTSALLTVLGGLDVEEKSARQAIARTAADGWITSTRDGRRVRWELAPPGRTLLTEGAARIYSAGARQPDWDGRWLVVLASVPETQRKLRHRLQTRLAWAGLGNPAPGLWVSPHPERTAEVERIITELGLTDGTMSFVGAFGTIGDEGSLVNGAWNMAEVATHYEDFLAEFADLVPEGGEATLLAQVRLVHAWRRFPFLDPQLPDSLLPAAWIGHRARESFDGLHALWAPSTRRHWAELTAT
jgi:phenylacetic acid degradation operon negative regulatory protein